MSTSANQGPYATTTPAGYGTRPAPGYGETAGPLRNGMGTAALVVGVLAIVTAITVFGGVLLGIIAIVLGVVGAAGPIAVRRPTALSPPLAS